MGFATLGEFTYISKCWQKAGREEGRGRERVLLTSGLSAKMPPPHTQQAGRQAGWLEPELSHRLSMLWGKARQAIQILLLPL